MSDKLDIEEVFKPGMNFEIAHVHGAFAVVCPSIPIIALV